MKKLLVIVFALLAAYANVQASLAAENIGVGVAVPPGYAPKVSDERGVKVIVTPLPIAEGAVTLDFQVVLETHTRDLGEELTKSSVLIVDGRQYVPSVWEGAPPGGHHRKGLLRFGAIIPHPPSLELQIRLSGETSPRSFKWQLKRETE